MSVAWGTFEGDVAPLFGPLDRREHIIERDLVKRGLFDSFRTLAEEGGLPLWLYHQPGQTDSRR